MQLDLDVSGRRVVIFGRYAAARRAIRRYRTADARVTAVIDGPLPEVTERPSWVRFLALPDDDADLLKIIAPSWLVVSVGVDAGIRGRLLTLCEQLRVPVSHEAPAADQGSVTLVGGGPGVTTLLTVAACEALRDADVVFYDRLAPSEDLRRLAPTAELVDVGKSPMHHRTPQDRIEDLLVERARRGQSVVRLKGGDSFVFGRGGEEMITCAAAGIPVRVVPGVSSSIAVPAAAGIPVTHRGLSHAFTVISGHAPPTTAELSALVGLGGTIVILMGMANLHQICTGLSQAGMDGTTPAAVVERGYSESQRTTVTTLDQLPGEARRLDMTSPAVVVIGAVARLGSGVTALLDDSGVHRVGSP